MKGTEGQNVDGRTTSAWGGHVHSGRLAGQAPTGAWLSGYLWVLVVLLFALVSASKLMRPAGLKTFLKDFVRIPSGKIVRAAKEIERKTFHVAGVLVPLAYQVLTTSFGVSTSACTVLAVSIAIFSWAFEIARLSSPAFGAAVLASPMGRIMREKERARLTGTPFFATGCALAVALFAKEVAITAMLHLILGDMVAALIGVSFGGETCVVKLGRGGNKSVEGSLAMFAVCTVITASIFANVHLCEYIAVVSALVATLTELWSEDHLFGLNDNITIPLFSSLALTWALQRTAIVDPGAAGVL